jgi:VWFA-related protein
LRSTTRLVRVSVIVEDKHGKPITGLSKNNFSIMDNGKPEDIQVFLAHETETRHSSEVLPPDTYSNRLADRSTPMSATAILLDGLNTRITDQQYARLQVIKFLQQIQPQDRVALYTLGGNLRMLHDFTNDASSLLAVLQRYAGRLPPAEGGPAGRDDRPGERPGEPDPRNPQSFILDAPEADMFSPFLSSLAASEGDFEVRDRVGRTIDALKLIANHVALLPGRKNLVWVSGSFLPAANLQDVEMNTPDGGMLFTTNLDSVARSLNNASLVVYPVDARGLVTGHPDIRGFATMDMLAKRTGGKAFYETNDIFGAIRDAVDDSVVSYELGYYPEIANWDGSFHKVRVSVNRPGVNVRTRQGYFAAQSRPMTPQAQQAFFSAAVTNLLSADGIGVTVRVNPPAAGTESRSLRLDVILDPEDLSLEEKDTHWNGTVGTVFVQVNEKGAVLSATGDAFQFTLSPEQYLRAKQNGFSYKESVTIQPGASELRVLVRDAPSARIGAAAVPLSRYFPPAKPAT